MLTSEENLSRSSRVGMDRQSAASNATTKQRITVTLLFATSFLSAATSFLEFDRNLRAENATAFLALILLVTWCCPSTGTTMMATAMTIIVCFTDATRHTVSSMTLSAAIFRIGVTTGLVLLIRRLRLSSDSAKAQARIDLLTGLPNRRALLEILDVELQRSRRFGRALALVMIDCDGFKKINDQAGHQAGDQLLQQLAEILKSQLRAYDSVGRLGGDEFLVILPETCRDHVPIILERLRAKLIAGFHDEYPSLGFSIGVASISLTPAHRAVIDGPQLLNLADQAMYRAKRSGPNQTCFADSIGVG